MKEEINVRYRKNLLSSTQSKNMKKTCSMQQSSPCFKWLSITVMLSMMIICSHQSALAADISTINNAAMKLVQFCADPKVGLDSQAVATLIDYVLMPKSTKEGSLPTLRESPGAYYEFDTRISFPRFLEYSYSPRIPSVITRPSSMRYSLWTGKRGELHKIPRSSRSTAPGGAPVIIHGLQHDSNTPDLTTGVYYEYDLKRTIILLNHKGRHVLISISKQMNKSNVGKKGVILGSDNDWNYYYSGEPGSTKAGLGWVKSYIYDYFSVGIYTETGTSPAMIRTGAFQWIRAGWSGINFVKTNHILSGMKRFARNSKIVLESPNLPAPKQIISTYQHLSALQKAELIKKYAILQQAKQALAVQSGKIGAAEIKKQSTYANIPKEQIIEELMLEYVKMALGRPSLVDKKVILATNP